MLKVYKMNDYDWVISSLSKEEINEWYIHEVDCFAEDQTVNMIEESTLDDGLYNECELSDIVAELEHAEEGKTIKVLKAHGYWIWESFESIIKRFEENTYETPQIICSTEG